MKKSKKLILTLASIATISTVGFTMNSSFSYTASAAKHHKKHHVKKHVKKSSSKEKEIKDYQNKMNRFKDDISFYNNFASSIVKYVNYNGSINYSDNPGNIFGTYTVDSGNDSHYTKDNYTDISNSLSDIVHDMNDNNDNYDKYADTAYDTNTALTNGFFGISQLQGSVDSLYQRFRGRFSDSENSKLSNLRDTVVKNNINSNNDSTAIMNQWNNVKAFYTELSTAFASLSK